MVINSKEIEIFKNLSQFDLGNIYYDFHNDFDCIKISLENNFLLFLFKKNEEKEIVSFKFENIDITKFEFSNFSEFVNLTIDNLYRGRFEKDDQLIEFDKDGKAYFYLEFYEGVKMELWCENIVVKKIKEG